MNSDQPLVSVVVLSRNSETTIAESLESLGRQSYRNLEILIIDGGSSDRTLEIVQTTDDPRIRVVHQQGKGLGDARNLGIREARAEFVAYLDSDDVALPDRIEKQLNFLRSHPDHVIVGSWLVLIDENGRELAVRRYVSDDQSIRRAMASYNPLPNPGVMFRKQALIQAGLYTEVLPEDYDLWFRTLAIGKMHNLPEVLTKYRVHLHGSKVQTPKYQLKWSLDLRYKYWRKGVISPGIGSVLNNAVQVALLAVPASLLIALFKWSVRRGRL